MKVGLVDTLGHHGGLHYYNDQLARGLHQAGVDFVVYGLAGDSFCTRQQVYQFIPIFNGIYGKDPALLRGIRFLFGLLRIFFDILRRGIDLVHIHVWEYSVLECLQILLSRLTGRKIVLTIHDVDMFGAKTNEWRRKFIMESASGFVVHNSFSLSCIPAHYLQGKPVAIIPHACYVAYLKDAPSRETARERLQLPQDRTILLFFGNPRHEKGLDIAMKAMTYLKDMPESLLLTGGRLPEQQEMELRAFIQQNGLESMVRMDVGTVADDVAFDYYLASNLVLVPYRRIYESGVAIMAASCARPIVASDLPVLIDYAEQGRAGVNFRSEDAEHMAQVIRQMVQDPDALRRMGEYARSNIFEKRSATTVGEKTAVLYRRVATGA